MSVTVVTATLPEREEFLHRAVTSVRRQTLRPQAHLIGTDYARRGGAAMKNDLWFAAETKWIALLDDICYDLKLGSNNEVHMAEVLRSYAPHQPLTELIVTGWQDAGDPDVLKRVQPIKETYGNHERLHDRICRQDGARHY